ncbi:MAG: tRNA (adenosine(37)-N6)-threonylcarbamoyltransferase complex transferase subunit TsaD [Burkholderiaceae bacterium]
MPHNVLGIESSCDETGIAIVDTAGRLRGQSLFSQIDLHRAYGGVVPELASRDHIRRFIPLLDEALANAAMRLDDIDAIAVTTGPGLPGALLAGACFAYGLAFARRLPVIDVHHLEGHLLSPLLSAEPPAFPFTALLVSGGHTQLLAAEALGDYRLLGETLDDAAGEAFDKTAKLMGLPYPGGPALAALAEHGDATRFALPRPMLRSGDLSFSFSGLKTAVLTTLLKLCGHDTPPDDFALSAQDQADLAASFQAAATDVLIEKSLRALQQTGHQRLVVAGGVGANRRLREHLQARVATVGAKVYFPAMQFCTDNGAMIALAGALRLQREPALLQTHDYAIKIHPRWMLPGAA